LGLLSLSFVSQFQRSVCKIFWNFKQTLWFLHACSIAEQKEKLSEVEIQAKKAEVAQRRKMQVEKAAKEAEVCLFIVFFYKYNQQALTFCDLSRNE
jgi:ABC-type metal ion transport system substrate-binding protein